MNVYYNKFIDFFERHHLYDKEMFDYLRLNSTMFDYRDIDKRNFIGCFWTNKNGYLNKVSLVVPFIDSDKTVLINIHEYIHGIMLYKNLGKRYNPGIDRELLPMVYEKLYVLENPSAELMEFEKRLDQGIDQDSDIAYKLGLFYRDELINMYHNGMDFDNLNRKGKRLSKKVKFKSLIEGK